MLERARRHNIRPVVDPGVVEAIQESDPIAEAWKVREAQGNPLADPPSASPLFTPTSLLGHLNVKSPQAQSTMTLPASTPAPTAPTTKRKVSFVPIHPTLQLTRPPQRSDKDAPADNNDEEDSEEEDEEEEEDDVIIVDPPPHPPSPAPTTHAVPCSYCAKDRKPCVGLPNRTCARCAKRKRRCDHSQGRGGQKAKVVPPPDSKGKASGTSHTPHRRLPRR